MEQKTERKDKRWWKITKILLILIFIVGIILCYSHFIAPHNLKTKEIKIINSNITNSFHGLKIVQFSDLHYGLTTNRKDLTKIQKEINRLKADIVVFTGDLFEQGFIVNTEEQELMTDFLKGIEANISKYAITGEDDYSVSNFSIILENGGFLLLDEKYDTIYNDSNESIFIAGMSTSTHGTKNAKDKMKPTFDYLNTFDNTVDDEGNIIPNTNKPIYNILIMHEPDPIYDIDYTKFDLVLAGHSHLGQIKLPFIGGLYYPNLSKTFRNDHYTLESTELYISSGIGTTKIPFRLFNSPEINLYRITNQ